MHFQSNPSKNHSVWYFCGPISSNWSEKSSEKWSKNQVFCFENIWFHHLKKFHLRGLWSAHRKFASFFFLVSKWDWLFEKNTQKKQETRGVGGGWGGEHTPNETETEKRNFFFKSWNKIENSATRWSSSNQIQILIKIFSNQKDRWNATQCVRSPT